MSSPIIKRLVICSGSIQLVTALSVLNYREKEQQKLNPKYVNYLVVTPLWTPPRQDQEFASLIMKIAKSAYTWKKVYYIPQEQKENLQSDLNSLGLASMSSLIHKQLGLKDPNEIYLTRNWKLENILLMNIYEAAERICYGDSIGIYLAESAFPSPHSPTKHKSPIITYRNFNRKLKSLFKIKFSSLKEPVKTSELRLKQQEFNIGYFSLPSAYGEVPPMETVILERSAYLENFQKLRKKLGNLIDISKIKDLRIKTQEHPTSVLLTSNFSEAAGRMCLENEIAAYRDFLLSQIIPSKSILLIKPHPRDSKHKIIELKSKLSDLYSSIIPLSQKNLFYLPFELIFMELFLDSELRSLREPKIFSVSSACLSLEFLFRARCHVGFGKDIVQKSFYEKHVNSRIKHEADLLSTINEIRMLSKVNTAC